MTSDLINAGASFFAANQAVIARLTAERDAARAEQAAAKTAAASPDDVLATVDRMVDLGLIAADKAAEVGESLRTDAGKLGLLNAMATKMAGYHRQLVERGAKTAAAGGPAFDRPEAGAQAGRGGKPLKRSELAALDTLVGGTV